MDRRLAEDRRFSQTSAAAIRLKDDLLARLRHTKRSNWPSEIARFIHDVGRLGLDDSAFLLRIVTDLAEGMRELPEISSRPLEARDYRLSAFWKVIQAHRSAANALPAFERELTQWIVASGRRTRSSSEHVERVKIFIKDHYTEPVTLDMIAGAVGRQRQYVATLFHREAGLTLHEYLTHVRIHRAWDLIRQGEKIDAVALLVGYRSKKNFYRQFKALAGVRPGEYARAKCAMKPYSA